MTTEDKREQPRLDPMAIERISGPSWDSIRSAVFDISETLLSVSPDATNNLTTIYVKFERPRGGVYAVMWVRTSSKIVVGLALPSGTTSVRFHEAHATMKYPGLTSYFTVQTSDDVPDKLADWAREAFAAT